MLNFKKLNFKKFASDRSGATAIIFSLSLVPLLAAVGAAVSYSQIVHTKTLAQSSVDTSALSAGLADPKTSDRQLLSLVEQGVRDSLNARPGVHVKAVRVKTVNNEIIVEADVATKVLIGAFLGQDQASMTVRAAVPKRIGQKEDYYFLLDNSASMGLAATETGRKQLMELTYKQDGVKCAFACHDKEGAQKKSNLRIAQEAGIQTRVDVLRVAVNGMIDKMIKRQTSLDAFRVAIDTFDDNPVRAIQATTDLKAAKAVLANYALGGNTSFSKAMPMFNKDLGMQGDGVAAPRKYAILVTDGVQGRRDRAGGFRAFDYNQCNEAKARGITMIVLNAKYLPMPDQQAYNETVKPIENQLEPALQACASSGWYFSATDQTEIMAAFDKIDQAIQSARLRLTK